MACNNSTSLAFTDNNCIKNTEFNKPIYQWKIKNNFDFYIENIKVNYHLYVNKVFLLDLDKFNNFKENVKIDIIEKLVYNIYKFHYKKFNELSNSYITFSLKTNNDKTDKENEINLKIKYDEYKKNKENKLKFPLLHSITYLTDSIHPLLITNIDNNQYKFKEFKNEERIVFCFPKKGKHIVFDPSKYHSYLKIPHKYKNETVKEFEDINLSLEVTLWEPENIPQNISLYVSINNINDNGIDNGIDNSNEFDIDFENVLLDNVEKIIDFYQDYSEDKKKKNYDAILDKKQSFLLNPTFF